MLILFTEEVVTLATLFILHQTCFVPPRSTFLPFFNIFFPSVSLAHTKMKTHSHTRAVWQTVGIANILCLITELNGALSFLLILLFFHCYCVWKTEEHWVLNLNCAVATSHCGKSISWCKILKKPVSLYIPLPRCLLMSMRWIIWGFIWIP